MTIVFLLLAVAGIGYYAYSKEPSFKALVDGAVASVKAKLGK